MYFRPWQKCLLLMFALQSWQNFLNPRGNCAYGMIAEILKIYAALVEKQNSHPLYHSCLLPLTACRRYNNFEPEQSIKILLIKKYSFNFQVGKIFAFLNMFWCIHITGKTNLWAALKGILCDKTIYLISVLWYKNRQYYCICMSTSETPFMNSLSTTPQTTSLFIYFKHLLVSAMLENVLEPGYENAHFQLTQCWCACGA